MTVENGASPNEEAIAKRKMAQYTAACKVPKQTPRQPFFEDIRSYEDEQFLRKWHALKEENRKKWKI